MSAAQLRPLDGMLVLDLTANVAGPLCGQVLADLGAEVIKIEPREGEAARRITALRPGVEHLQPYFVPYNRGKRSLALDLRDDGDREALLRLVDDADVFVQGYRPGAIERLGLGPDAVAERNPRCVYASLSAYGGHGDLGDRPGVDLVVQAEAGCSTGLLDPEGRPQIAPFQLVDGASGHVLAQAVLAALLHRERHGVADHVEVSMYDVACSLQANHLTLRLNQVQAAGPQDVPPPAPAREAPRPETTAPTQEEPPTRQGRSRGRSVSVEPSGVYPAADGHLVLVAYVEAHWRRLTEVVGRPDLADDPRFHDQAARSRHAAELRSELETILRRRDLDHWIEAMEAAGLMAVRARHHRDVVTSEMFERSGMAVETTLEGRRVLTLRTPARYGNFTPGDERPLPSLGQDQERYLS